jgi:hypothetical protein
MKKHANINEVKKSHKIQELATNEEKLINGGNTSIALYGIRFTDELLIELGLLISKLR